MYNNCIYIMMIINILVIIFILVQPSIQQDTLSLLSNEKNSPLFKTQKALGINFLLRCSTTFLCIVWLGLAIVLTRLGA